MNIRQYVEPDKDAVVDLSLRAWADVFVSMEQLLRPEVYREFYPDGWRTAQQQAVEAALADPAMHVRVAVSDHAAVAGFVAIKLHREDRMGEIHMIAVDPDSQAQGIGAILTDFAVDWMREAGMSLVMVETGGDPGHAPARRLYERSGFDLLPIARYFRKL